MSLNPYQSGKHDVGANSQEDHHAGCNEVAKGTVFKR